MRKSIPISDDLAEYFTDPCPVLSDNNVQMISDEISKGYDYVVEYGMGSSTLYFLKATEGLETKLISIENNFDWFKLCIDQTKAQTQFKETAYSETPWSMADFCTFIEGNSPADDVPGEHKRIERWKESLALGPFFRFSPEAKSRFRGKFGPLWPIAKPFLKLLARLYYMTKPSARPYKAEWRGVKDQVELILRNVGPSIKDQFGEAPNMMDYINAGLKDTKQDLEAGKEISAIVMIDGGPRHKIVQEVLRLEEKYKNFKPTIVLCDACRAFYKDTLNLRPQGRFIAGTNKTLKGIPVVNEDNCGGSEIWSGGKTKIEEFAAEEVWLYKAA